MKVLTVCSVLNFRDFTRRATIEAIKIELGNLDVLLFVSFRNRYKKKVLVPGIEFSTYYFWVPDKLKKVRILRFLEHFIRKGYWVNRFKRYDWIFFTDPNQAWLLPYITASKVIYLIRDPNILQNKNCVTDESSLLRKAEIILATNKNLANVYLHKYYTSLSKIAYYWPNCVDIRIWKRTGLNKNFSKTRIAGIAGNFGPKRTDYKLIDFITTELIEMDFEIAGILDIKTNGDFWMRLFKKPNVKYLGIIPSDDLPSVVSRWDVGLITERADEFASYMHHNKVYQYLASGIPVVSLKIHNDYNDYQPYVFLADNHIQYSEHLKSAIEKVRDLNYRLGCIEVADKNSSSVRAKEFCSYVLSVNGLG